QNKNQPADRLAEGIRSQLTPGTTDTAVLVQQLNEILKDPDLYQRVDPAQFNLPNEAMRLADVPGTQLTEAQIVRRNPLLLEAAFPQYIAKLYGPGWRPTVIVYGLVGLLVAAWFWFSVRDRPEEHPRCNAAEVALIEGSGPGGVSPLRGRAGGLPLRAI